MTQQTRGIIIAAPASGSGKTVLTLGLLRHLARSGVAVASAKAGPDYIDPAFHSVASGRACVNLDPWAMRRRTLEGSAEESLRESDLVVCEGVMGLFDGPSPDRGTTSELVQMTGWPAILVVDARGQGASAAAVVRGFATHRPGVRIAGVLFNRVASQRHEDILRQACAESVPEVTVLGCIRRHEDLALPERHLGLIQAGEHADLEAFLNHAADAVAAQVDLTALRALAEPWAAKGSADPPLPPPGQRIAIADDRAFAFRYPPVVDGWRRAGSEVSFFSPLADESPDPSADAVYLPGGYPELHAGRLAGAGGFLEGLRQAAARGAAVFGECGGYMVLGRGLVDAQGTCHQMAGLLALETSFAERGLHLGYRRITLQTPGFLGDKGVIYRGHEFHYTRIVAEGPGKPLFTCEDAQGRSLGLAGLAEGRVMGSFIHLIDKEHDD